MEIGHTSSCRFSTPELHNCSLAHEGLRSNLRRNLRERTCLDGKTLIGWTPIFNHSSLVQTLCSILSSVFAPAVKRYGTLVHPLTSVPQAFPQPKRLPGSNVITGPLLEVGLLCYRYFRILKKMRKLVVQDCNCCSDRRLIRSHIFTNQSRFIQNSPHDITGHLTPEWARGLPLVIQFMYH